MTMPKLFSLTPALDNLIVPKKTTSNLATENIQPPSNNVLKNTRPKKIISNTDDTLDIENTSCTLVAGDATINIRSDKCVNVLVTNNISEQKYIKNIEGAGALCAGTLDSSNVYTNIVANVCKLGFDTDSGFEVTDLGSGLAKIGMNSTFKYWEVNGSSGLTACGLDTVNFVAGSGVTITSDNSAIPKSLTISSTVIGVVPGGCNTQFQYNNNGSFEGAYGLTYDSATCNVGMSKITVPQNQNLQINVSNTNPAWWSLYGDPSTNTVEDYSSGVVYDSNGNIYIIGANGTDGIPFLVKYDSYGNVVWQKVFNESNNYYKTGDAVAVDTSGNVYCLVGTDDSINDITIFKITSSGTVVWQTTLTASVAFTPKISGPGLATDSVGNVYASLMYEIDGTNEFQALIKLNSSGVLQWQKVVSGDGDGYPQGLTVDNSDNIIMNGQYATPSTSSNILLTKFDASGNLLWQKGFANPFDGSYVTQPGSVTTDSSNNIIITAARYQTADNYTNGSVVKLDSNGNLLWQVNFPGDPTSSPGYQFYGAAVDSSNNIYVTGYGGPSYSNINFYIVKLNSAGSIQWQRSFGSSANEYAYWYWAARMIDVSNTNYVINGYSYAKGGNADAITAQLPTDGSLTGTYGLFTYESVTLTTNTTEFVVSTPSMPVTDGSLIATEGIFVVTDGTKTEESVKISGGNNTININSDGTIELPSYSFPFTDGQNCQYLTTNGSGTLSWSIPIPGLDNNCSIAIRSCGNSTISGFNNVAIGRDTLYCNTIGGNNVAIGFQALYCNTVNGNNLGIGVYALKNNIDGFSNVAIGYGSQSDSNGGGMNIGIGHDTLKNICNSTDNVALGAASQRNLVTGSHNISLGFETLKNHVCGGGNIAIGYISQRENICGNDNVGVGAFSLLNNTTGNFNVAVGHSTLANNQNGGNNVAIGYRALEFNNTGNSTVAVGAYAGFLNRASSITAIGDSTLSNNTTGTNNTAVGAFALNSNTTGISNVAIGSLAALCNLGSYNTAIGVEALRWGASGCNNIAIGSLAAVNTSGTWNVAIGNCAMYQNTIGECNVAIGGQALQQNTTGYRNIAIGKNSSLSNTIGGENNAIGYNSLYSNTTGNRNFAIGSFSLYGLNGGNDNVGIGIGALRNSSSGCFNVAIGIHAGCCNRGNRNTFIGNIAGASVLTGTNNTIIGNLYGSAGLVCTVLIGAGTCERIKVDNNGLCINGAAYTPTINLDAYCSFKVGNGLVSSTGISNVAIGCNSLVANTTGIGNIGIGESTLCCNTNGYINVAIGYKNLQCNTTGYNNIAFGKCALQNNNIGDNNIAMGEGALCGISSASSGSHNIAIGRTSLACITTGIHNIGIGYQALNYVCSGTFNIALGYLAGSRTTGDNNIIIGCFAACALGSSSNVIAIGPSASKCNNVTTGTISIGTLANGYGITGTCNIAIGYAAAKCSNGCNNIAIGYGSIFANITGVCNLAIGGNALRRNLNNANIGIGYSAGCAITTGTNNTIIGTLTGTDGLVCTVLIGAGTCERIKVDNNGLCINGALISGGGSVTSVATSGAGLGFSLSGGPISTVGTVALTVPTASNLSVTLQGDGLDSTNVGYRSVPQNSQSTSYTLVAADNGKHIYHPASDATPRTYTIPSNAIVTLPIGSTFTFVNNSSAAITISINSDTLILAGTGTTGSRTLAQYGFATAIKVESNLWYISGAGLT